MSWIKVSDKKEKHIINTDAILGMTYKPDTNLTEIVFIRSAYPSIYAVGDITKEFTKTLAIHDKVYTIGETI